LLWLLAGIFIYNIHFLPVVNFIRRYLHKQIFLSWWERFGGAV